MGLAHWLADVMEHARPGLKRLKPVQVVETLRK